ncbi:TatD family hydrolase [Pseudaeromonas paramecii]|uniref:TatD family hydrolase n=1 Tax=Pseudaeromonas paramecii TaxID=2138166 RepID=A0ABP8Q8B5_9GAMM
MPSLPPLIDTHVHLDLPELAHQLPSVLARSRSAGVTRWLVPAVDGGHWAGLVALAARTPGLYYALGLHPWCLSAPPAPVLAELAHRLVTRTGAPAPVAIGECGLDGLIDTPLADQQWVLEAQLRLACEHELPLILHSRKTHSQLLGLLRRYRPPAGGVIHGFSGSQQEAQAFWSLGFCLGVGGVITHARAAKSRQTLAAMPAEALLLETDAPSMPLAGRQGESNQPAYLPEVLHCLAGLRGEEAGPLARQLNANAVRLFRLPPLPEIGLDTNDA